MENNSKTKKMKKQKKSSLKLNQILTKKEALIPVNQLDQIKGGAVIIDIAGF